MSGEAGMVPDPYHGVHDTLEKIATEGHKLAIVTARDRESLNYMLRHHRLDGFFSAYRTWEDIERLGEKSKPAPDQLLSVMRELGGFDPGHTVMIGDTTMDMHMAQGAMTKSIGVTWGSHTKEDLEGAGAHHVIEDGFHSIVPVKRKLFGFEE